MSGEGEKDLSKIKEINKSQPSPQVFNVLKTGNTTEIGSKPYGGGDPPIGIKAVLNANEKFFEEAKASWGEAKINQPWEAKNDNDGWGSSDISKGNIDSNWVNENKNTKPSFWINDNIDYSEKFKDIAGKTIEEIVSRIPKNASGNELLPSKYMIKGFEYIWIDSKENHWRLYIHDNYQQGVKWIARITKNDQYMDSSGNFHDRQLADNLSDKGDKNIIRDTHIPIQSPESYISPINDPEHYGREKQ